MCPSKVKQKSILRSFLAVFPHFLSSLILFGSGKKKSKLFEPLWEHECISATDPRVAHRAAPKLLWMDKKMFFNGEWHDACDQRTCINDDKVSATATHDWQSPYSRDHKKHLDDLWGGSVVGNDSSCIKKNCLAILDWWTRGFQSSPDGRDQSSDTL